MRPASGSYPPESKGALYIHRLVSRPHLQGGSYFLKRIEDYARQLGKHYIRLDSMTSNQPLAQYYQKHGFIADPT